MPASNSIAKKPNLPTKSKNSSRPAKVVREQPSAIAYAEMYSGPIPKGDELIKYEQAFEGAASRIITMAEEQAAHRQALEMKVVSANIIDQRLGLWFAFIIALVLVCSGTYLIINDKSATGIVSLVSGPGIPALIYLFIQRKASEELKEKDQELSKDS